MSDQIEFSFESDASNKNTFDVLHFEAEEGLSSLFRFEIFLRSLDADLDLDKHINVEGRFELDNGEHKRKVTGILSEFDAVKQQGEYVVYRAVLVPYLWRLTLFHTNEVYLNMKVREMIAQVMEEAGFSSLDFRFELTESERKWAYRCQYDETHFNFLSRILEREGIYYFFEDDGSVVFCDHLSSHQALKEDAICFSSQQGDGPAQRFSLVSSLVGTRMQMPGRVILRDFNDDTPSVDVVGEAQVSVNGMGEVNVFGQNILDVDEGVRLAKVRAEELLAKSRLYQGISDIFRQVPGYTCQLSGHFRKDSNQDYCLISQRHYGYDPRFSGPVAGMPDAVYQNEFSYLPSDEQYRPELKTPRSEIKGTLRALIDSEGDGQYAEIDEQGRYKVSLPFDRKARGEGKASHWVRMMQPFGGEGQGMHFPMRAGARVLLSFIGGDPDRPVISGAIPDAGQPSIVTGDNQTNSMIKTAAGNKIEIEDKDGKNRIKLQTGDDKTYMHLGSPNHAGDGWVVVTSGIERKLITGGQRITLEANAHTSATLKTNLNTTSTITTGTDKTSVESIEKGNIDDKFTIGTTTHEFTIKSADGTGATVMTDTNELSGSYLIERRTGDKYLWTEGNEYIYGGGNVFEFGNGYTEIHANEGGCDSGERWPETGLRLGVPDMPTGATSWAPEDNLVEKIWANTFNYQNGKNYSWGDTCDYEFGNGYSEALVDENAAINSNDWPKDKHSQGENITGDIGVTIDPDNALVEKTIGDTYSYQKGNGIEVMKGNTNAYTYGDAYDWIDGDSEEHIRGSAHSTHHGATNEMFMGAANSMALSVSNDTHLGITNEMFLGVSNSMALAATNDIFVGMCSEMKLALMLEITAGIKMELDASVTIETKSVELDTALTELKAKTASIENIASKFENMATKIGTRAINIATGGLTMIA